jgi:hypothetical protein
VRLEEFYTSQNPIDLRVAYAALTADVISTYSYGKSYDTLKIPDFEPDLYRNISSGGELALVLRHYPWILNLASLLPEWLVAMDRNVSNLFSRKKVIRLSCCTSSCRKGQIWSKHHLQLVHSYIPIHHFDEKTLTAYVQTGP